MKEINSVEEFEEILQSESGKKIIDFYANWCMPCKMLSPILEEIINESEDIEVYKVNIDDNGEIALREGIMSIPTLYILENGVRKTVLTGLRTKEEILNQFN